MAFRSASRNLLKVLSQQEISSSSRVSCQASSLLRASASSSFMPLSSLVFTKRCFASLGEPGKHLLKTIQTEIEHETTNFEEDKENKSFLEKEGWTLSDKNNDMMITLEKRKDGKKITVEFSCIQSGSESLNEEGNNNMGGNNEMCDFTITVETADESGISFFCSTTHDDDDKFRYCIGQIRIFENKKDKENINIYPGPYFEDLDDSFQQSLDEWLAHYGINSGLCDFIDKFAAEKEQKEYISWLTRLQQIVQK